MRIPYTAPVRYRAKEFIIPPYMLGGLLADGYLPYSGTITWTKNDQSVIDEMTRQAARANYTLVETTCRTSTARHFRFARAGDSNQGTAIRGILGGLGLIGCRSRNKFIPPEYLTASVEQRRELLAGLMDGDGSVRKDRGTARYCTTSRKLAEDVRELCWSLGVDAKIVPIRNKIVSKCFDQVIVRGSVNPFGAHPDKGLFTGGRQPTHRSFYRIERAGRAKTVCLAVEAEDKLFVTKDYLVTHNTMTSLASAKRSLKYDAREPKNARILIVAPLHTIDGWRRHVREVWGMELRECTATGKDRKANLEALWDKNEAGVFFIGWSLMTARNKHKKKKNNRTGKMVSAPDTHAFGGTLFDVVIADEVHRACNPKSLNSKVLCRIRSRRRLALSATPAGNLPVNIFGALHFLWPQRYTSFTRFADFFFKSQFNPYSDTGYGRLYGEEKQPGRVRATTPCWVSVTRQEALPDLPDVDIRRVAATMTRDQKRIYKQWQDKAIAWLDDHPVAVNLPVVLDTRLQQATLAQPVVKIGEEAKEVITFDREAKSGKIDALLDILQDLGDERVIVFTHSRKFLIPLRWRLEKAGYRVEQVSGDDHEGWRTFRDDHGVQILLAVVSAIAEGVDGLQTDCHTEIWLSRDSSLVINEQAHGRLHRSGQTRGVVRYLVQCPGTIDDTVVGRLAERHRALTESGLI